MRDGALTVPWACLCRLGNACLQTTLSVCLRLRQTASARLDEAAMSTINRSRTGLACPDAHPDLPFASKLALASPAGQLS